MDEQCICTDLFFFSSLSFCSFYLDIKKGKLCCKIHIIYINEQISKSLRMFSLSIEDTIYMADEQIIVIRVKENKLL
jgi:hypothetical protein